MRTYEWLTLALFAFLLALVWLRPLATRRRLSVTAVTLSAMGLLAALPFAERFLTPLWHTVIRDWLPAPFMLVAYWQAGRFFTRPQERLQEQLWRFDQKLLGVLQRHGLSGPLHPWVNTSLELAYLLCYPLVPAGIGVLYLTGQSSYAVEFWEVVLPPTYVCYVLVPFTQTLPPRLLAGEKDSGNAPPGIRALNLRILRHASIQANTLPSAHVAASMAVALELLRRAPLAGVVFLCVAVSIAVGSVVGRYHYAADSLIAAALALLSFFLFFSS